MRKRSEEKGEPAAVPAGVRREGDPEGPPLAVYDPKKKEMGHLDLRGEWVPHECPAGFRYRPDGTLEALEQPEGEAPLTTDSEAQDG